MKTRIVWSVVGFIVCMAVNMVLNYFVGPVVAASATAQLSDSAITYGATRWLVEGGLNKTFGIGFLLFMAFVWCKPVWVWLTNRGGEKS